ncbi:MAG: CBS domain-containing protein, partial [Rhodocyclaceae bacterium]|nr:CBS domain-containing protein [Rhodocyclaceae bacterium]
MVHTRPQDFSSMTVQTLADLMTWNVIDIDPASPLGQAAAVMERAHISSLLVTRGQEAVGILTERDLLHALHKALPVETPVSMVMSSPVLSAPSSTPVLEAYHLIASRNVRHLLVVDEHGEPTGIVSESDFRFHMGSLLLNRLRDVRSVMMPGVPSLPRDARLS